MGGREILRYRVNILKGIGKFRNVIVCISVCIYITIFLKDDVLKKNVRAYISIGEFEFMRYFVLGSF